MSGRATIVISHNLTTVRDASEIVLLENGRVAERGTHADLLENGGPYSRLYALQRTEDTTRSREPRAVEPRVGA